MYRSVPMSRSLFRASVIKGRLPNMSVARLTSSTTPPAPTSNCSQILSGFAGGSAVVAGGYGWYYFSGAKDVVNKFQSAYQTVQDIQAKAPPPGVVVNAAKSFAGPFLVSVPGAQTLLDQLQKLEDKHGPEIEKIWKETSDEVAKITAKGWDEESIKKVNELIKDKMGRIQELGKDILGEVGDQVLNAFPQVKEAVGGSLEELKALTGKGGEEAQELVTKTYADIKKVLDKGFNENTVEEINKLIKEKMEEAKKLLGKAGDVAWDKGLLLATPVLDKMPEVKKMLEQAQDSFADAAKKNGPQVKEMAQDLIAKLKKLSEKGINEKSLKEAKTLVEENLSKLKGLSGISDEAWKKAADVANPVLKKVPELKKIVDEGIEEMKTLAEKKGPEAFKIITDTYSEIQKIAEKGVGKDTVKEGKDLLEKKLKELKALKEEAKNEGENVAKDKASDAKKEIKK
ncbi:hypothetical protein K7432_008549 [Basidiobolus ranarum]|uniref:Uncharacterized protein n=1 Tax=Basidiobolus ranarum TaxID=34480 RepID=A0ABR2VYF7_9FUNG